MNLTESQIRESIENNIETFRNKALRGKVDGEDVATLFGYGDLYKEGLREEEDLETLKSQVKEELLKEEGENSEDKEDGEEHLEDGETTTLNNYKEFFDETNSRITINKESSEPSPLFGESPVNHNKYKITLINDKGGEVSWYYWDSESNTSKNKTPDVETVMKDFGKKLESVVVGISFENFKKQFGYDFVEDSIAQKQYEGLRKIKDAINKLYPNEHNVYQLIQLAKKNDILKEVSDIDVDWDDETLDKTNRKQMSKEYEAFDKLNDLNKSLVIRLLTSYVDWKEMQHFLNYKLDNDEYKPAYDYLREVVKTYNDFRAIDKIKDIKRNEGI